MREHEHRGGKGRSVGDARVNRDFKVERHCFLFFILLKRMNHRFNSSDPKAKQYYGIVVPSDCPRFHQDDDDMQQKQYESELRRNIWRVSSSSWNQLNIAIFVAYSLSVASVAVPITLASVIATDVTASQHNADESEASFASKMTSSAVLGTSLGKFINGGLGDVFGARRTLVVYSILGGLSLLLLSISYRPENILFAGALIEFFQSVQWPCLTIMLTSHYGTHLNANTRKGGREEPVALQNCNSTTKYETAINIVALSSRFGAIISIPFCSMLLRKTNLSWRKLCRGGSFVSLASTLIYWIYTRDSPSKLHDPINPPPSLSGGISQRRKSIHSVGFFLLSSLHVVNSTILPSLRTILSSGTFWTVSLAHTGGSIVRSSERLLGTFFENTSDGTVSKLESGEYPVVMAFGLITGLMIWGTQFSHLVVADAPQQSYARVYMIQWLYALAVGMCLVISLLAMPIIRDVLNPTFAWGLKVLSCFILAASLAVQYYHIPPMVASSFYTNENHRGPVGLYVSYTDGVACAISSFLIRTLGRIVQNGNPKGYGWAFCWGDIAIVIAATGGMMVHYLRSCLTSKAKTVHFNIRNHVPQIYSPRLSHTGGAVRAKLSQWNNTLSSSATSNKIEPQAVVMSTHDLMLFESDSDEDDDNVLNPLDDASTMGLGALNASFVEMIPTTSMKPTEQQDSQWKHRVLEMLNLDQNTKCVDCGNLLPRWASIIIPMNPSLQHMMGCFCCEDCVSFHRRLGVHIVFVRSVDHDIWKEREVEAIERGGNCKVNSIYEALLEDAEFKKEQIRMDPSLREDFIVDKYQRRRWRLEEGNGSVLLDLSSFSDTRKPALLYTTTFT
jgi:hypothetical protein